jgi:hypothetical protein
VPSREALKLNGPPSKVLDETPKLQGSTCSARARE